MNYSYAESIRIRIKYLDRHIMFMEKELRDSRKHRESLVQQLEQAEKKELQDVKP